MIPRSLSFAVLLAMSTAALAEAAPQLSAADCALLHSEYGVRPPGCAVPAPAKVAKPATRVSAPAPLPVWTAPLPELSQDMRGDHVFFPGGGATLDDAARRQLVGLIALLNGPALRQTCLRLVGHSDRSGAAAANLALSEERARTVAAFLSAALGTLRIAGTAGAGDEQPLDGFAPGARENRRVAIYLGPCFADLVP